MHEIVNREREIEQLRQLAEQPPALVVLRGRRRVGKSFLLRVALTGDRVVSLQAEEKPLTLQLEDFARECSRLLPGSPPLSFSTWGDALEFLERQAQEAGPLVTILDEFQYLAVSDSSLPSAIQAAWDRWDANDTPIMLVLSGSALSFMEGLLGGSAPTFGRSVYRPLLLPLSYRDCAAFAPKGTSAIELIERYGVLGGTPQYQRWGGERPLEEIIFETILPTDSPLHTDPEHLIRQEGGIREPGPYFGTLEAIASGRTALAEIAGRLGITHQLATHYLKRLGELAYVTRIEPLEPGGKAASRAYWRIADPYFRFWFRYVFPNRSRLVRGRLKEVAAEIKHDLPGFLGRSFEDACREWVGRFSRLGANSLDVGSWWSRRHDREIDVVTIEKDGYGVLGSCKWSRKQVGVSVLDELHEAKAVLGPKAAQAKLAIFSRAGFTDALVERASEERVELVDPDRLLTGS